MEKEKQFGKIKNFWKKHPKKIIAGVIVIILITLMISGGKNTQTEDIAVVRGSISQEVVLTGKTVSQSEVELGFDRSGRVATVPVKVGTKVSTGQILATLENADLNADLLKARASLSEEETRLDQIKQNTGGTLDDARANLIAVIREAYVDADDALRNKADRFFKSPRQAGTRLEFSFKDGNTEYNYPIDENLRIKVSQERYALESVLIEWNSSLGLLDSAADLSTHVSLSETNLNRIKGFLDDIALAANSIQAVEFQYQTTINTYKSDISSARTTISNAISNLISAKEKVNSAPRTISGSTGEFADVVAQESRVNQWRAAVKSAEAQVAKTIIRTPFSGIVIKQDAKVGETVTAGVALAGVLSPTEMEIEANVSEVNIGKVNVGNKVNITFDAFPANIYTGVVTFVEPGETVVDNVVNYKVHISIEGDVTNLKSGLTSNLRILTDSHDNVLTVPAYAILGDDGKDYLMKVVNDRTEKVEVETGILGSNGRIEILRGINEGEIIRVPLAK